MVSTASDTIFKILLLGDSSVGKTCFLLRYVEDTFTGNHISTIGVDYKIKIITSKDSQDLIKLQIWDTAGQDRFRCITKNYYRGSNGIMLIYDITNQSSFTNIKNWISQIKEYLGEEACITLVGNKVDLESNRKIATDEGRKFAMDNKLSFFEASAKENISITEAFEDLTKNMLKKSTASGESSSRSRNKSLVYSKGKEGKKKCCG